MAAQLDLILLNFANRAAANPVFDWLMPRITNLHQSPAFLGCVGGLALWAVARGNRVLRGTLLAAVLAVAASDLLAYRVVKQLVHRPRPCHTIAGMGTEAAPGVRLLPEPGCPGSPSFPSNHAANTAAFAAVAIRGSRGRKRWSWLALPLVIGFSRVYLGFHYPSDVLAGWALGGGIGAALGGMASRSRRGEQNPPS